MAVNLKNPNYYFNRELSWLKFNERVLEEAMDSSHPLLERLKFLAIFSSNLDEFFMIRVAGLKEQVHAEIHEVPADGLTPMEQTRRIGRVVHSLVEKQSRILLEDILPKLRRKGVRIRHFNTLTNTQKEDLRKHFKQHVFPVLTPMAVDPTHPFPQLRSLGINLLVELKEPFKRKESKMAVLPIPQILDRFVPVPGNENGDFVAVEDLIKKNLDILFPNMRVVKASEFRITRNADLDLSEAEADDLLKLIERELRKRRLGTVIRLEVAEQMSPEKKRYLRERTGLQNRDIYDISGYLDLSAFFFFLGLNYPELKDKEFTPALNQQIIDSSSIFSAIRKGDILLHHPYESFSHVIELIQEAAADPKVLAIKQTLYRTSGKSPIVQALKDAVANGKQVTALIELKARFDEETNIVWAKELERSGVNVIYGLMGLKTHCKVAMIVRKEDDGIRRYVHMGTGNYNAKTAKLYTDFGLMTCNENIGKDASELFNLLTGYSLQEDWREFLVAPMSLRKDLEREIRNCVKFHKKDNPSKITMVMNSLVDPGMIRELYKASIKGIRVDLVVRGICCLKPGIKGVSENITVRSIVGRFLEHPRVYHFEYNQKRKIYLGSADLMQRNLNRRIELVYPVHDEKHQNRIIEVVQTQMKDNVKARELDAEGNYIRVKKGVSEPVVHSQEAFLEEATERRRQTDTIKKELTA